MNGAIHASDFRPMAKGALKGSVVLTSPSGLVLKDCAVMNSNGRLWIAPPARPQIDREGRVRKGENGRTLYTPIIDFASKEARDRFQAAAVAAVETLLG